VTAVATLLTEQPRPAVAAVPVAPVVRRRRPWDPMWVAVLTVALSAAGSARPSLWFDEAATLSAATRPLPALWRMTGNIDAVHGLYYLMMHGWFAVFPATEFASRFSSALAAGLAAAGVVVVGRQLSTRAVAVTAGIVFAVLPRVTWAGMETRSYALSMAVAVWLTVLCVTVARRGAAPWWIPYSLLLVCAAVLNVFLVLLIPAHAVAVALFARRPGALRYWAAASVVAVSAVVPFLAFTQSQLFQVRWISRPSVSTVGEVLQEQYFDRALPAAIAGGLIILAAIAFGMRFGLPSGAEQPGRVLAVAVTWIAAPTGALLMYSALDHPIYYPRYLSFTAPAFALLLGLCIVVVANSRSGIALLLVVLAATAAPTYLFQRSAYAKAEMDYSAVADVIGRFAAPGDCLVLDNSTTWKPGPIRPLTAARPSVYDRLRDYGRGRTALDRNMLWDSHIAVWAWADKMPDCPALWTVSERDPTLPDRQRGTALTPGPRLAKTMAFQVPERLGFRIVERWQFSFAQVVKSTRTDRNG